MKVFLATVVAVALVGVPSAALAAPPAAAPVGYDVSYPQCGKALPASPAFGIVGVNDGIAYSANPCLATQYAWALKSSSASQTKVQFYANTGNPGPVVSTHWAAGGPRPCTGGWDADCSYDYGWSAAQDSFNDANNAAGAAAATAAPWWLDVESANSWSTDQATNISAIQGAVDFLSTTAKVPSVGLYSNASSWSSIVGSKVPFAGLPSWVPGARTQKAAMANCGVTITGGHAAYAQYASGSFDADYACP